MVTEYLPEFAGPGKESMLVHHLLTHTSGLDDATVDMHIVQKTGTVDLQPLSTESVTAYDLYVRLGYDAPLVCVPGEQHIYCQYGYELLGKIIERVSGQMLANFAARRIFAPLGMDDTSFVVTDAMKERLVQRPDSAAYASQTGPGATWLPVLWRTVGGLETEQMR